MQSQASHMVDDDEDGGGDTDEDSELPRLDDYAIPTLENDKIGNKAVGIKECCSNKCFTNEIRVREMRGMRRISLALPAIERRRNLRTAVFLARTVRDESTPGGASRLRFKYKIAADLPICVCALLYAFGYSPSSPTVTKKHEFSLSRESVVQGTALEPLSHGNENRRTARALPEEKMRYVQNFIQHLAGIHGFPVGFAGAYQLVYCLPPIVTRKGLYRRYCSAFEPNGSEAEATLSDGDHYGNIAPRGGGGRIRDAGGLLREQSGTMTEEELSMMSSSHSALDPQMRVSYASFRRVWADAVRRRIVLTVKGNECPQCVAFRAHLKHLAHSSSSSSREADMVQLLGAYSTHLELVKTLSSTHDTLVEEAKQLAGGRWGGGSAQLSLPTTHPSSTSSGNAFAVDHCMLSVDFSQVIPLPQFPHRPEPVILFRPYKCHVFGIRDEGRGKNELYIVREEVIDSLEQQQQCPMDPILSILHHAVERLAANTAAGGADASAAPSGHVRRMVIQADNCVRSTNVHTHLEYWLYRVMAGFHEEVEVRLRPPGHGLKSAPEAFSDVQARLAETPALVPADVERAARSAEDNVFTDKSVRFARWTEFLQGSLRADVLLGMLCHAVRICSSTSSPETFGVRIYVQSDHAPDWIDATTSLLDTSASLVERFVSDQGPLTPEQHATDSLPLSPGRGWELASVVGTINPSMIPAWDGVFSTWDHGPWPFAMATAAAAHSAEQQSPGADPSPLELQSQSFPPPSETMLLQTGRSDAASAAGQFMSYVQMPPASSASSSAASAGVVGWQGTRPTALGSSAGSRSSGSAARQEPLNLAQFPRGNGETQESAASDPEPPDAAERPRKRARRQ